MAFIADNTAAKIPSGEGDIRQYKKYGLLRNFVPLMVCISRNYFQNDEVKLNIVVEALCSSDKETSEFSARMVLLNCPRVIEKVIGTTKS